jgi:flagellar biosynthesis protein FliR
MSLDQAIQFVPAYVLVVFRISGLMIFAPLLGSGRIPRRVKGMIALVLAAAMCSAVKSPISLPQTTWELALGIGGELAFGLAMGMVLSFTFIAAQWAGEIIGQQMGLNISEVLDPQYGGGGSLVGDLYFLLTLVVFLIIGGHRQMIVGIWSSFEFLPLMSLGVDRPLFDTVVGLFQACTTLAMQLAAPMLVTMLVVDLALGCIGKTMPQINVMTAGLSVRSLLGLVVMLVGIALTVEVMSGSLNDSMNMVRVRFSSP